MIHRPHGGRAPPVTYVNMRKIVGRPVRIPYPGFPGRRQVPQTGVVRGIVYRRGAVKEIPAAARTKIVVPVRLVVGDAIRPTEMACLAGSVPFVVAPGAARRIVCSGVRPDVAPIEPARFGIDRKTKRIPKAHNIDFRARPVRADRKQIAFGNRIGSVRHGFDPENLATQIVGVGGRFLGVPRQPTGALVDRRKAVRFEWTRIVSGRDKQIAVRIEGKRARRMATLIPLHGNFEQNPFALRIDLFAVEREARNVLHRIISRRRIEQIDPSIGRERRVQRNAGKPILELVKNIQFQRNRGGLRGGIVFLDGSIQLDVKDLATRQDDQFHGIYGAFVQYGSFVPDILRSGAIAPLAHGVGNASLQVFEKAGFRIRLRRMSHAGIPRPAAPIIMAPRNGMVGRLGTPGIRTLVKHGEHMHRVAGVVCVVVPFVHAAPTAGKRRRGRVRIVRDKHRGLLYVRVAGEIRANQPAVPRPIVFRVGRRMDADETAAPGNIVFEGGLLRSVQHIARRVQENDGVEGRKSLIRKDSRVLGGRYLKVVGLPQLANRLDARANAGVPESLRTGENENVRVGLPNPLPGGSVIMRPGRVPGQGNEKDKWNKTPLHLIGYRVANLQILYNVTSPARHMFNNQ